MHAHQFKKLFPALLLALLLLLNGCLGRSRPEVRQNTIQAIRGDRIFINYPINHSKNKSIASNLWIFLQQYFSTANQSAGIVPMRYEDNINNSHIFLQIRFLSTSYNERYETLVWEIELSLKESYSSKYFLKEAPYTVVVKKQNAGENFEVIENKAKEKLGNAIAYYLKNKRLPQNFTPLLYN